MFKVQKLNKIDPIVSEYLPADQYEIADEMDAPDAIIVRRDVYKRQGKASL